jgi:hypothetical protein
MFKLASLWFLSTLAYGTDLASFQITTTYGAKDAATRSRSPSPHNVTVFPGDDALPQMADGGGWKTQIILVNLSNVRMPFVIDFWRSDGSSWPVSITGVGTGDRLSGGLDVGATAVFESAGLGELTQGWAELTYDTGVGRIGGLGVFRQTVPGRPDFEAVVPLSSLFDHVIVLPYDNTAGFNTGVAAVNGSRSGFATVTANFRDENGATYATDTITLPASGHTAFALPARFPATQGRRGTVLFRSNTEFFSVLGLRFHPGGAFTSFSGLNTVAMLQ